MRFHINDVKLVLALHEVSCLKIYKHKSDFISYARVEDSNLHLDFTQTLLFGFIKLGI